MLSARANKPPNLSDLIIIYFSLITSTWIFGTCFLLGESGSSFFVHRLHCSLELGGPVLDSLHLTDEGRESLEDIGRRWRGWLRARL